MGFELTKTAFVNFSETSDDEPDDGEGMTEVRFAPDEKANLQVMFTSMSHCQSLHPDDEGAENLEDEVSKLGPKKIRTVASI